MSGFGTRKAKKAKNAAAALAEASRVRSLRNKKIGKGVAGIVAGGALAYGAKKLVDRSRMTKEAGLKNTSLKKAKRLKQAITGELGKSGVKVARRGVNASNIKTVSTGAHALQSSAKAKSAVATAAIGGIGALYGAKKLVDRSSMTKEAGLKNTSLKKAKRLKQAITYELGTKGLKVEERGIKRGSKKNVDIGAKALRNSIDTRKSIVKGVAGGTAGSIQYGAHKLIDRSRMTKEAGLKNTALKKVKRLKQAVTGELALRGSNALAHGSKQKPIPIMVGLSNEHFTGRFKPTSSTKVGSKAVGASIGAQIAAAGTIANGTRLAYKARKKAKDTKGK